MNVLYYIALWLAVPISVRLPKSVPAQVWPGMGSIAVYASIAALAIGDFAQLRTATSVWSHMPHSAVAMELPVHALSAFSAGSWKWVAFGVFETLCLAIFLRTFKNTPLQRYVALCGAAVLSALALTSVTAGGPDLYEYVAQSLLGAHAYAPPNLPFSGSMAPLNQWGVPVMRSTYGPLWTLGTTWLLQPIPSLAGKILALRAIGLLSVVLCAVLVGRASGKPVMPYLVLLNPFVYWAFVVNAHNDLLAVDLALVSALLVPGSPLLAGLAAIACGFIKLPLLLVSWIPIARTSGNVSTAKRCFAGIAVIILTIGLSWLAVGAPYFAALFWYARYSNDILIRMGGVGQTLLVVHTVTLLAALVVIARSWLGKRSLVASIWTIPCIASGPFQQYQAWSLPVFLQSRAAAGYLAGLPVVMACSAFNFFPVTPLESIASVVVLVAVFAFTRELGAESE